MLRGRITITADLSSWAKLVVEGNLGNINIQNESKELGQSVGFTGPTGSYSLGNDIKSSTYLKARLMMNKEINKDLSISGYIGTETQRYNYSDLTSSTAGGLNYPGNYFLANSVKAPLLSGGAYEDGSAAGPGVYYKKTFNSLYASADISYKNRFVLQATWR